MNNIESTSFRIKQRIEIQKEIELCEQELARLRPLRKEINKVKGRLVKEIKNAIRALEIINNRM